MRMTSSQKRKNKYDALAKGQEMWKFAFMSGALAMMAINANADDNIDFISGACNSDSHLAEGPIGSDLTKLQSQFFCDNAVIRYFDDYRGHLLVQFVERGSSHPRILGFAGRLGADKIMQVENVYIGNDGTPSTVSDGYCQFNLKSQTNITIMCAMKLDEVGRRTIAVVDFEGVRAKR